MDVLSINQQIYIRRSDGRVHLAGIIKLDGSSKNLVTVEWREGELTRGKEVALDAIIGLNPQIYGTPCNKRGAASAQANAMVSIAPRPANPQLHLPNLNGFIVPRLAAGSAAQSAVVTATPRQTVQLNITQDDVVHKMERLRMQRECRRQLNSQTRALRQWCMNSYSGNPNWEVARMLHLYRLEMDLQPAQSLASRSNKQHQILVCVRKRPLNLRELKMQELDMVSVPHEELLVVHEPRKQVTLAKFLEHHHFRFDHTFDEHCNNTQVYERTARPLVRHIFEGGMATCFAYGQTGSGKTHTMGGEFMGKQQNCRDGIYAQAANDVFATLLLPCYARLGLTVSCSFFELYGSRVYDLLMSGKPQLRVLEDGQQHIQVVGLTEEPVQNTNDVLTLLELGNSVRTSGQTSANSKSSRSHAVFQIVLRSAAQKSLHGKFSLIDLAGNERGADNCSANRQTRLEGAEINKSLLALKECIRALGRQSAHLPFRGSKLTQVLRDSFIGGKKVKTCMIATISPGLHSVEHTLNTLRYADRVKELTPQLRKKGAKKPILNIEIPTIVQTNSLPDITNQGNQLNRVSSSASLPETEHLNNDVWSAFSNNRELEDDNLEYFNQATDDYSPSQARDASSSLKTQHSKTNF
ncbi:kinesin-like protein Klp59C [Drosophila nasuta]|uniref:kinesin-like protein Klp59C n=1 Tax=Drosophila nasuta TaxID=42062 RepID=UPI00295EA962|nr:kinesin-like protein Klp59C [Drosophila nasuta]